MKIIFVCALMGFIVLYPSVYLFGQTKPKAKKLGRSVVLVKCYDINHIQIGWGSGVIIDSRGTCITNYHVLEKAYFIRIKTEDGVEYEMDKIIGESEIRDLIKFTILNTHTTFIPVVLCKKLPEKGDDVWAMGTPVAMDNMNAFTPGAVTNIKSDYRFVGDTILQINNAIAHGSSGGGLFNSIGELVGITSAGRGDEDGARAAMNYAIYAREILNLSPVYKDRLESAVPVVIEKKEVYTPIKDIPKYEPPKYEYHPPQTGKVSFYTDWSNNTIRLSIDGNNGALTQYFPSSPPLCGQNGTVTFDLPPGTYTWRAIGIYDIESLREKFWDGVVTVTANDCKLVFLPKPYDVHNASEYKPKRNSEYNVPVRSWMLGVGTSGGTSLYLDKYFRKGKYDLQLSFDGFVYGNSDQNSQNTGYSFNYSWNKYGIGYYRVFSTNEGYIDFALRTGLSIRYLSGSYSGYLSNGKINDVFINWRAGLDVLIANRILIRGEVGYGYATQGWIVSQSVYPVVSYSSDLLIPKFTYDYDLLLGYKFGKMKKRHKITNRIVKHIPELLLPGETDLHLAKNMQLSKTKKAYSTKGRIKMGLFFASAATAIGSNIYSKSEYSKYTAADPNSNISHYNNANLAHKIALTSSAVVVGLYLNDIVHFCAKIKTIKYQ